MIIVLLRYFKTILKTFLRISNFQIKIIRFTLQKCVLRAYKEFLTEINNF